MSKKEQGCPVVVQPTQKTSTILMKKEKSVQNKKKEREKNIYEYKDPPRF